MAVAGSTPFSRIIVFGDSLSDTGNLYWLTGGSPPSPPYFEGRSSNGPLWIEYLAKHMGMESVPQDNYAVAGATTGQANSVNAVFPGLQDELDAFLAAEPIADPEALYVIWAGHVDLIIALGSGENHETVIGEGVRNTLQGVQILWGAGARQILVANLGDLGLLPLILGYGIGGPASALSAAYNQALEAALEGLAAAGIPTILWDAFATHRAIVNSPSEFGFTDVTDPFLPVGLLAGDDPAQYYYWDDVHPTTHAHRLLAEAARNRLIDYFSPRQGKGAPPALVNALNGLVQAGKNH